MPLNEKLKFCKSADGGNMVDPTIQPAYSNGTAVNGLVNHTMTKEEGTWTRNKVAKPPASTD